jgi:uncharacterized membrane protein YedE/YeeE
MTKLTIQFTMQLTTALLAGLLFGLGLIVSGMTDPAKVIGFLDITGHWDPSLALVMGGAILVGLVAFRSAGKRTHALLGEPMRVPTASKIDRRLILGAIAFGAGWGLAGYCPGPALASLLAFGEGSAKAWLFALAMFSGMAIFEVMERVAARSKR